MTTPSLPRSRRTLPALAVLGFALAVPARAAAAPPEVGHFSGTTTVGPMIVTDQPCFDGTPFTLTGGESFKGTFVAKDDAFTFTNQEKFFGTLVPVGDQGPTYVEAPNVNKTNFTSRAVAAGDEIVFTNVNNDRFYGYVDGVRVSSATIRIHQLEHYVGLDTDGDGAVDSFKVSVSIDHISCPA